MLYKKTFCSAIILMLALTLILSGCALGIADFGNKPSESEATQSENEVSSLETESSEVSEHIESDSERAMNAYKAVMLGEKELFNVGLQTSHNIEDMISAFDYNEPMEFTVMDLDGEGIPEIIITWESGNGEYRQTNILHYNNGTVYGYGLYCNGAKIYFKTDGTYSWAVRAYDGGSAYIDEFSSLIANEETFMVSRIELYDEYALAIYEIDGKRVMKDEYDSELQAQNAKPNVKFYDYNEANIAEKVSASFNGPETDTQEAEAEMPDDSYLKGMPVIENRLESETTENDDGGITTIWKEYYDISNKLYRTETKTEKNGVEIYRESIAYYENGELKYHNIYNFDENGEPIDGIEDYYSENGVRQRSIKEKYYVTGETITTKDGEVVMEKSYIPDGTGDYETYAVYYMDGEACYIAEQRFNENQEDFVYDWYINSYYDGEKNLLFYNTGRTTYYPLPDGRLLQMRLDDPADELYITMRLGEGDESEYVALCILYDLDDETEQYGSVRFEEFGEGWDEESVKELYDDYLEYTAQVDSVYDEWQEYVYG